MNDEASPNPQKSEEKRGKKAQAFRDRFLSTICLWVVIAAVCWSAHPLMLAGLVLVISMLGLWEYSRLIQLSGYQKNGGVLRLMMLAGGCVLLIDTYYLLFSGAEGYLGMSTEIGGAVIVVLGAFTLLLRFPIEGRRSLDLVVFPLFGYTYVAILLGAFILRLLFNAPGEGAVPGIWLVIWLIVTTKFTDMGAYLTGSLIGKHKMCPHISPQKTWQGFVGALGFAQLGAWMIWFVSGDSLSWIPASHVGFLGVLLAVLAVIGDLAESIIKRSLMIKDSGNILPGIGGVLDLIDSICFTAPVVYFYMIIMN